MNRMRNPVSVTHLVLGLAMLGLAGAWALHEAEVIEVNSEGWVFPLVVLLAGAAGLLAAVVKALRRDVDSPGTW